MREKSNWFQTHLFNFSTNRLFQWLISFNNTFYAPTKTQGLHELDRCANPFACRILQRLAVTILKSMQPGEEDWSRTKSFPSYLKNSMVWVRERIHRPSDRRLSAKWSPTFADRGCHVVSVTNPYGRILGFLDRSRYFSIKYSSVVLMRLSGSRSRPTTFFVVPGNLTRDPCICSQELWPLDHRGGPISFILLEITAFT
jgi:hypothetical protein